MKVMNKFFNIAIVFSVVVLGVRQAEAADTVTVGSSIYLSEGTDQGFKTYMSQKAKRFVKKNNEDWAKFNEVVRLYNTSKGKFLNLNEAEKADFYNSVSTIKGQLNKMNGKEANYWLQRVDVTEKVFAFIWNNKIEYKGAEEIIELPSIRVHTALGR